MPPLVDPATHCERDDVAENCGSDKPKRGIQPARLSFAASVLFGLWPRSWFGRSISLILAIFLIGLVWMIALAGSTTI